jgi:hypothetical protein
MGAIVNANLVQNNTLNSSGGAGIGTGMASSSSTGKIPGKISKLK